MICEKCGKSNIKEESVCRYCGAKMPEAMESNGFADILSVNVDAISSNNQGDASFSAKKDDVTAQKLDKIVKKLNETIRATKRSLLVSYMAAGIGILALIISLVIGIVAANSADKRIEELEEKLGMKLFVNLSTKVGETMAASIKKQDPLTYRAKWGI